jgi:HSP20 family molecular chaperone IbpA
MFYLKEDFSMSNSNDFSNIINDLFFPAFDWDKKSYKFNRDEKDMHPYSIKNGEKEVLITHNILGIDKKDLKITNESENGTDFILIKGKTKDVITGKEYSVDSRFALDDTQLDLAGIKASAKNGLLYITIPTKKKEIKKESKNIEIL